jgi:predicted CopG family antitoxin
MTAPRKNIKIRQETYFTLKEEKRDMETWDSMLNRIMHEAKDGKE